MNRNTEISVSTFLFKSVFPYEPFTTTVFYLFIFVYFYIIFLNHDRHYEYCVKLSVHKHIILGTLVSDFVTFRVLSQ